MIKFINLNSGKLYTGEPAYIKDKNNNFLMKDNQKVIDYSKSYIHWLDEAQSTDIIYTKYICFISDKPFLNVSLKNNEVFHLLDDSKFSYDLGYETINNIKYKNIYDLFTDKIKITGINLSQDKYIYTIYFAATTPDEGEFIEEFNIDEDRYLIGGDFYFDNEISKINLGNVNLHIPDQIQKALYTSNVREDKRDNILLNRKWKELLSNYWDVVANKGSYKSLINSLKWFEYGDLVKIKEYWKFEDFCKTIYNGKSIQSVVSDIYNSNLTSHAKTTYIGLYAALQEIDKTLGYDNEKNPILKNVALEVSLDDLYVKMCLLGVFYETYFMPIHLDLIHSTIENIVFTNTTKILNGVAPSRTDTVCNNICVKSSVKDGDVFEIGLNDANIQVGPNTVLGTQYTNETDYDQIFRIGVDNIVKKLNTDDDLRTFWSQYYEGPGVIVPIDITISTPNKDEFINYEQISMVPDNSPVDDEGNKKWKTLTNQKIFNSIYNEKTKLYDIKISFKLLCTEERPYDIRLMFKSGSSQIFIKRIQFNVVCVDNATIKIYKVLPNEPDKTYDLDATKYIFSRMSIYVDPNEPKNYYTQYIYSNPNGIKLNNILIVEGNQSSDPSLNQYYEIVFVKETDKGEIYSLCVSKEFDFDPSTHLNLSDYTVYRNDYGYFPQNHHLEKFGDIKKGLPGYTITKEDTLCLVPNFSFGHLITDPEWEFENASTGKVIKLPSIQTPYVTNNENIILPDGYYNIIFKYKLGENNKILKINSAFLKKDK